MNPLTLRAIRSFPDELQHRIRAYRFGDIDDLVQQVGLALVQAKSSDTMRVIFNRARASCRRYTQDLAHYARSLDAVADAADDDFNRARSACRRYTQDLAHYAADDEPTPGGGRKRQIAREIAADHGVTTRRARQIIAAQLRRAKQGDLFAGDGSEVVE